MNSPPACPHPLLFLGLLNVGIVLLGTLLIRSQPGLLKTELPWGHFTAGDLLKPPWKGHMGSHYYLMKGNQFRQQTTYLGPINFFRLLVELKSTWEWRNNKRKSLPKPLKMHLAISLWVHPFNCKSISCWGIC